MEKFVQTTIRQRESWIRNVAAAKIDPGMVERFRRVDGDLRLLIVVEDLCPDTVHTVPYVVALAAQAGVVMRIIDRGSGAAMMKGRRSFNRSKPIQRMPDSSHSGRPGTKRAAGGTRGGNA